MNVLFSNGRFQIHVVDVGDCGQPSKNIGEFFGQVVFIFLAPFGISQSRRQFANFFGQPQNVPGTPRAESEAWYRSRMSFWNSAIRMAWLRGGVGRKASEAGVEPTTSAFGGQRSIQLSYSDWIVHPSVETGVKGVQSRRETANIGPLQRGPWYAPTDDQWQSV